MSGTTGLAAIQATQRPLTLDERQQWNSLLDYIGKRGLKGSKTLDDRNTALGKQLMAEYATQNPSFTLKYEDVPRVQNDLQNYRQHLIDQYRKGQATANSVADPNEIMQNISPVDGWLGSRTSSYKYPGAALNGQSYGLNTAAYDAAMAQLRGSK